MKNDQDFTEELGHSMPSSKRETEEDMLEELCSLAKKDARITIPEICGRMEMTRREVLAYLKQLSARGYVKTEENKSYVRLTELGCIRGEECRHRHETFTQFLEYVGVNSETAEEDACRMEHVASEETVQQIHNFINYGSTFERVMKKTDLRYYYEPGDYTFMMGIYYMEKTCPRRLTTEFKDYREQISLHVKEEDSCFELLRTDQEPSGSLVPGSGDRLDESCRKRRKPADPYWRISIFSPASRSGHRRNRPGGICQRRREPHGVEQPGAGCTYLVGGILWKKKTLKDCSIHPCCRSAI